MKTLLALEWTPRRKSNVDKSSLQSQLPACLVYQRWGNEIMGQFTGCLAHQSKILPNTSMNPYHRLQQLFIGTVSECLEKAGLDIQGEKKAAQIFLSTLET